MIVLPSFIFVALAAALMFFEFFEGLEKKRDAAGAIIQFQESNPTLLDSSTPYTASRLDDKALLDYVVGLTQYGCSVVPKTFCTVFM